MRSETDRQNNKRQRCSKKDRRETERQREGQNGVQTKQRRRWIERETEKGEGLEREPGSKRERGKMRGRRNERWQRSQDPAPVPSGPGWLRSSGELVPTQRHLGHAATPAIFFPWESCLKGSEIPLRPPSQPQRPCSMRAGRGQRVHSALSLGRAGRGAWQAALPAGAWPSGPSAFVPFPATRGLQGQFVLQGKISMLDSDPATRGRLCLQKSSRAYTWLPLWWLDLEVTGDFVSIFLLLSSLSRVTWGTPALRSICVSEP